ncbi:MAG TPA: hypothetical protein VHB79_30855 [Polyangiaceae bacterium]|nr:hypothetical protein [Polyangiaceae bacterium]
MRKLSQLVILSLVLGLGCSPSTGGSTASRANGASGGNGADGTGANGTGGLKIDTGGMGGSSSVPALDGTLTSSAGDSVKLSGQPSNAGFVLKLADGSTPDASMVTWSVDNPRIGTIDANGNVSLDGWVGGVLTVTATMGGRSISSKLTVDVEVVDPGTVSDGDRTLLDAGGAGDAKFGWLYPYDKTVFPRGLTAPLLQFGGTAATATYLSITTAHFSYKAYGAATNPIRVTIDEKAWTGVTETAGASDPVEVSVSKLSGGAASGPVTESYYIAQASLKGIIYYSTYRSPLTGGIINPAGGGLLRIRPGTDAEVVKPLPACSVCHSVSANGSVLALSTNNNADPDQGNQWNPVDSSTYDLAASGAVTAKATSTNGLLFSTTGLSPDGSMALTSGVPASTWSPFIQHGVASTKGYASSLVDTKTGADLGATTLSANVTYAVTPMFSPDGAHVAYVNGDKQTASCTTESAIMSPDCRHVLSMLDVDLTASPPTFSNPVDLVDNKGAGTVVAWPSFLPDSKGVIYHQGDSFDSCGFKNDANAQSTPYYAEIALSETADGTAKKLQALNGRDADGKSYLPYGEMVENRMNYEPNVLPLAVGGYYWVLFTSRRAYGNTIGPDGDVKTASPPSNPIAPGEHDPWGDASAPSWRKKIWIAAIDINHPDVDDPSHPAFFLPGQELQSGNMRAFGALPPCKPNGESCESGSDCCEGFCRQSAGAMGSDGPVCIPPPDTCSLTDEPCDPAKCCDSADLCINHRCTAPTPTIVR